MDKARIGIIGLGRTGTPLLEYLLTRPWAEVVGVADRNEAGRGTTVAREHGIFYTTDADVLAAKGREIDVIIEVTGDPSVKPMLKEAFQAQNNRETVIVHDIVARMLLSIVNDTDFLIETFHPGGIG
jgi:predicted dehydrogenase